MLYAVTAMAPGLGMDGLEQVAHVLVRVGVEGRQSATGCPQVRAMEKKLGVERADRSARPRGKSVLQSRAKEEHLTGTKVPARRPDERLAFAADDLDELEVVRMRVDRQMPVRLVVVAGDPQRFDIGGKQGHGSVGCFIIGQKPFIASQRQTADGSGSMTTVYPNRHATHPRVAM